MKAILTSVLLLFCVGCVSASTPPRRYSTAEIEEVIRSGRVGSEYAERAKKVQSLRVGEIRGEKIPYQLFSFSDFLGTYTLLVEAEERRKSSRLRENQV
jgi:hypothetical protein